MFDIGPEKLLFVFAAALIFLGPKEIPAAARTVGKWMRQVRSIQDTLRSEIGSMISLPTESEPTGTTSIEVSPTTGDGRDRTPAHEPGFDPGPSSFL